jgi:hypothetical protein
MNSCINPSGSDVPCPDSPISPDSLIIQYGLAGVLVVLVLVLAIYFIRRAGNHG